METVLVALRVLLSLGVVLALLWVVQRRISRSGRVKRSLGLVTVVARQGISAKASVVVVDVEGTRFLLGVTESSVTVLNSGDAPVPAPELVLAPTPVPEPVEGSTPLPAPTKGAAVFARSLAAVAAPTASASPAPFGAAAAGSDQRGVVSRALEGSILSPATWRQAAAALQRGRVG